MLLEGEEIEHLSIPFHKEFQNINKHDSCLTTENAKEQCNGFMKVYCRQNALKLKYRFKI